MVVELSASSVGDPHVTSVTGEKFDLWKTGWSLFVLIPKDIQPELVAYDGDKCGLDFLQDVKISGSMAACGHDRKRGIQRIFFWTSLGNSAAEQDLACDQEDPCDQVPRKEDDYKRFYEQFGKCFKLGVHEGSTDRAKIVELLRFKASMSVDEQISLNEYMDRMTEEQNDIYYITGESMYHHGVLFVIFGTFAQEGS